jgi:hypothetical protein
MHAFGIAPAQELFPIGPALRLDQVQDQVQVQVDFSSGISGSDH